MSWKNPYIDLVQQIPDFLLACENNSMSPGEFSRLSSCFNSQRKFFCDLGCGSGEYLINAASRDLCALYLGVELRFKRAYSTADKARKLGLQNVFVVRCDLRSLLPFFPSASLDGVYINFPDPWGKTGWKKHRFLTTETLARLESSLKPGGFISLKTDDSEYFLEVLRLLESIPQFIISQKIQDVPAGSLTNEHAAFTEFERLFKFKGLSVNYLLLRKISASPE